MKTLSDKELLRMINAVSISTGKLVDAVTVDGVSVWTFFQFNILNELRRTRRHQTTRGAGSWTLRHRVRLKRLSRWWASACCSLVFLVRTLLRRPKALVFSSDSLTKDGAANPRLAAGYQWLHEHRVSYAEVVHTTYDGDFFPNLSRRPIGVLYLEVVRSLAHLVVRMGSRRRVERVVASADINSFPVDDQPLARHLIRKYYARALESVVTIRILSVFLHWSRPRVLLTVDDIRHHNELLVAARRTRVSTTVFQHSNFDHFYGSDMLPPERYIFADRFVVWSRYWAERLPRLSPLFAHYRERIAIGGRSSARGAPTDRIHSPRMAPPYHILVPFELGLSQTIASRLMTALAACPHVRVVFSLRADTDTGEQLERYGLTDSNRFVEVVSSVDLNGIDAAIGVYSTFLDDLVAMGVPVGIVKTEYETFHDLVASGLATSLTPTSICQEMPTLVGLTLEERERRRQVLIDGWGNIDTILSPLFGNS